MAYTQQFTSAKMGEEIEELENTPRNKHTHLDTQRRSCNRSPNNNNNQNTHKHTQRQEELQQQS
jgi:hypothetical protein